MVSLGKWTPLVALVFVTTLFAGCVGDEDADPAVGGDADGGGAATGSGSGAGSGTGASGGASAVTPDEEREADPAKAGCQFQFCIEGHVYAPVWDTGMTWTYDVAGTYFPTTDYSAKFGVFKVNDDHYLLGTDSDTELKNSVARFGVMTGAVQKDSYSVLEHEAYQDLLGFLKVEDTTWKSTLWDREFTLVKEPSMEISHAKGASLGIQVNGASDAGDVVTLEYASDVAWLTKLEWKGPEGEVLLSYTLTDFDHAGSAAGMKSWERSKSDVFRAIGNTAPVGAQKWSPGSEASLVLMHVETDAGVTGNAAVVHPDLTVTTFQHTGPQTEDVETAWQDGDWYVAIAIDRGAANGTPGTANMAIFMYSVIERAA